MTMKLSPLKKLSLLFVATGFSVLTLVSCEEKASEPAKDAATEQAAPAPAPAAGESSNAVPTVDSTDSVQFKAEGLPVNPTTASKP